MEVLNASAQKCENHLESSENIEDQLIAMLNCMREESLENCVEFVPMQRCKSAIKFYHECRNASACRKWPKNLNDQYIKSCCKLPRLLSHDYQLNCEIDCKFDVSQKICLENCLYGNLTNKNSFTVNMTLLKESLKSNHDKNIPWNDSIEDVVDICHDLYNERGKFWSFCCQNSLWQFLVGRVKK
jgi:hypothetical protein